MTNGHRNGGTCTHRRCHTDQSIVFARWRQLGPIFQRLWSYDLMALYKYAYYYYYYYYIVSWSHPRPKRHHGCFSRFAALTRVPSRHTDRLRNGHWAQCWRCGLITTKASVQCRRRWRGATVADADELAEWRDASLNVVWMEECYTQVTVTWFRSLSTPVDFCHAPSSK